MCSAAQIREWGREGSQEDCQDYSWAGCQALPFSAALSMARHPCSPKGDPIKLQSCSPTSEAPHTKTEGTRSFVRNSRPGLSGLRASSIHRHVQSWCQVEGLGRTRSRNLGGRQQVLVLLPLDPFPRICDVYDRSECN